MGYHIIVIGAFTIILKVLCANATQEVCHCFEFKLVNNGVLSLRTLNMYSSLTVQLRHRNRMFQFQTVEVLVLYLSLNNITH